MHVAVNFKNIRGELMGKTIYSYESGYHCTDCTTDKFGEGFTMMRSISDYFLPADSNGDRIFGIYTAKYPATSLECEDCHDIIDIPLWTLNSRSPLNGRFYLHPNIG